MCDVLDRIENKGRLEGLQEGELKAKKESAFTMFDDGMPIEKIAKYLDKSVETIKEWIASRTVAV